MIKPAMTGFMSALDTFFKSMNDFEKEISKDESVSFDKWKEFQDIMLRLTNNFEKYDFIAQEYQTSIEHFKERFRPYVEKSLFGTRANDWPQGYPGDHITLEYIYKGFPQSPDLIGQYVDLYFMSRHLAVGVRERKDQLKNHVQEQLNKESCKTVLNVGCGSSRELYDIGLKLNDYNGKITCLDFDGDALTFSARTLASRMINLDKFEFRKMNVLKLVNSKFMNSELGTFDLIYSAGLFDYIQDKGLKRIFGSMHKNLNEGGMIIAPFKDCEYYTIFDYHWLGNWDAFYQRTKVEVWDLLKEAIPGVNLKVIPSSTPAINFYIITK